MQAPEVNATVARELNTLATMLRASGAAPVEVKSFQNACHIVSHLVRPIDNLLNRGVSLSSYSGVSETAARKTAEIVTKLRNKQFVPTKLPWSMINKEVVETFSSIPGIGPVKARNLIRFLSVSSIEDLRLAAAEGKVAKVPGFGKKTEARLLARLSEVIH